MPGFGPASAPVASCGVLGYLGAPDSYNFDYIPFSKTLQLLAFLTRAPAARTEAGTECRSLILYKE